MSLPREVSGNPTAVNRVAFSTTNKSDRTGFRITAQFQLCNAAGIPIKTKVVDITNDITAAQKTAMENFLAVLRSRATQEILP